MENIILCYASSDRKLFGKSWQPWYSDTEYLRGIYKSQVLDIPVREYSYKYMWTIVGFSVHIEQSHLNSPIIIIFPFIDSHMHNMYSQQKQKFSPNWIGRWDKIPIHWFSIWVNISYFGMEPNSEYCHIQWILFTFRRIHKITHTHTHIAQSI